MKIRHCLFCEKGFTPVKAQKYCSKECGVAFKTPPARACAVCGIDFVPTKDIVRVCSAQCRQEERRKVFPTNCVICGGIFKPKVKTQKSCSIECRNLRISQVIKSQKPLSNRVCKVCGQHFQVRPSVIGTGNRTAEYCSRRCSGLSRTQDLISVVCAYCGTSFEKQPRHVKRAAVHYCSQHCHHADIKAPKEVVKCPECGVIFEAKKARKRRFCSSHCKGTYMTRTGAFKTRSTSIEITVGELLSMLSVVYLPQFRVGKYVCDFYVPASNLVIECDGDYWHSIPNVSAKDKRKDEYLKRMKYKILRLPEWKIKKHLNECLDEIKLALNVSD